MKRKSHAPVPPAEEVSNATTTAPPASRRKSVARKANSFDVLEPKSEITSADRPAHIIDFQLMINNIAAFDLEDTGTRFDEQDPLVSLSIGEATAETARQEDAGVNANFPESFVFDLTEEDVNGDVSIWEDMDASLRRYS